MGAALRQRLEPRGDSLAESWTPCGGWVRQPLTRSVRRIITIRTVVYAKAPGSAAARDARRGLPVQERRGA